VKGPEPRVPELEIPCLERGAEPKGVGKLQNNRSGAELGEPGVRVFKLKTKSVRGKLKEFYDMLTSLLPRDELPKSAFRYRREWENSFIEVIHSRLATGKWLRPAKKRENRRKRVKRKSSIPKRPPFLLTARFILSSGEQRGRRDAPVVVDLRRREVRIPRIGVAVPIPERLARALEEENRLEPRPEFVVQLCSDGRLRIIAKRAPEPRALEVPLRIIAVDENSRYGFVVAVFDFDERGYCRLTRFEVFKPPNHGHREGIVAALKSYADKPGLEALERVRELLPFTPTPDDAERLARAALARKKRLNNAFIETLVAGVRELVRGALQEGAAVAIVVDPINSESLQGTPLQGTLLRVRERLRNLARYEGAHFAELRASGRYCPFCGAEGVENGHRVFKCPSCGATWDRDRAAVANLVLRYLKALYREECQDADPLRLVDAMRAWLKRHIGFLLR
jgi:hypothetical protein